MSKIKLTLKHTRTTNNTNPEMITICGNSSGSRTLLGKSTFDKLVQTHLNVDKKNEKNVKQSPIETNMDKIRRFQKMPRHKQKSQEWLDQRNNFLTASSIASALGLSGESARRNLLINKASNGKITSFNGNVATQWGNKYEYVANMIYSYRNDKIKIYDFGLITNEKYPILGISPDGITENNMLEIKCPWSRVINGKIKLEYQHQIQEQLAICEFDVCHFLECTFKEISEDDFWGEFDDCDVEQGIIISYIDVQEEDYCYKYSTIDLSHNKTGLQEWRDKTIKSMIDSENGNDIYIDTYYWYIGKYNCQSVNRDPNWIINNYPILKSFWDEVEHYRVVGLDELLNNEEISPIPNRCLL